MKELEMTVLTKGIEEYDLKPGDVGTVVHVYNRGEAYEVEFLTKGGKTVAVLTLDADEVRPFGANDLMHVRQVSA